MGASPALASTQLAIGRRFGTLSLLFIINVILLLDFAFDCSIGIVTPNASLIVLDKLEQYLKHDIPPPPR
jgi:hypothetical protein